MSRGSEALTNARKDEIINSCAKLYETMSFKDITIKEIGKVTSFTRTSIYNYFQTKEEIFLALLQREYEEWSGELYRICEEHDCLTMQEFAVLLAKTVEKRPQMLKLLSMNMYDMEANSSLEHLIDFKVAYGETMRAARTCLDKFYPEMLEDDKKGFIFAFFPFLYGIYPYVVVSEKQKSAMKKAGVELSGLSIYEITYNQIRKALGN